MDGSQSRFDMLEIDPVLASRALFRQAQSFEVEYVDRTPLRRGPPDVRFEFMVGQSACRRQNVDDELSITRITPGPLGVPASLTVNWSSAISKGSFAAPSGSSLKAAVQRRLFSGVVGREYRRHRSGASVR